MKVCIIGDKKNKSDLLLLEIAKERFPDLFFVPVSGIRISLEDNGKVFYRSTDLQDFDLIIPRIVSKESLFAYQFLDLLSKDRYIAIRPVSYLIASNRFFMFNHLRRNSIPTQIIYMAKTPSAAQRILQNIEFPITLRIPELETVMIANTQYEAKTFIDTLERLEKPILIEKRIPEIVYRLLVVGSSIVQSTFKIVKDGDSLYGKGNITIFKSNRKMENLAKETAKVLDTDIARVDMAYDEDKLVVVNVVLKPSLIDLKEDSKKVISDLLESIINSYNNIRSTS